ncbi:MAG: hypothetical protein ACKVVP_13195 [Chloroflexota bacterium]
MLELYNRAQVKNFIIWNEPNDGAIGKHMDADVFAALLRSTWLATRSLVDATFPTSRLGQLMIGADPSVKIYWGGVYMGKKPGDPNEPDPDHIQYIQDVYDALKAQRIATGDDYGDRSWPWHGINVHPHENLSIAYCNNLRQELSKIQAGDSTADTNDVLIGEWGIKLEGLENQNWPNSKWQELKPTFDALRLANFTVMFYFAHHQNVDANGDAWGLRCYHFVGGDQFTPCPDVPNSSPAFKYCRVPAGDEHGALLSGRLGPLNTLTSKTLYNAFQSALDGQ